MPLAPRRVPHRPQTHDRQFGAIVFSDMVWLIVLGALLMIRALWLYGREGRFALVDEMGLSIRFDQRWIIGAVLVGLGVALLQSVHWGFGIGLLVLAYMVILPLKRGLAFLLRALFGWGTEMPPGWRADDGFKRFAASEKRMQDERLLETTREPSRDESSIRPD